MKLKYVKVVALLFLIISIVFFLWNSIMIFVAGFVRECDTIIITDNNRAEIVSLMKENINCYEEIPDISRAKEIEYTALMHKDNLTVYYEDETTYDFFIDNSYNNPLVFYIQNEGHNVYFNSSEFIIDLIKTIIPLIFSIVITIFLILKKQSNSNIKGV